MPSFLDAPKTSDVGVMQTTPANDSSRLSLGDLFTKGSKGANSVNQLVESFTPAITELFSGSQGLTGEQKSLKGAKAGFDIATTAIGFIPGVGQAASLFLQGADWLTGKLGKKANKIGVSESVGSSSGYRGLSSKIGTQSTDISAFNSAGGITRGLSSMFGGKNRSELDSETKKLKDMQSATADILNQSKKRLSSVGTTSGYKTAQTQLQLSGLTGGEMRVGKDGLKIIKNPSISKDSLKKIILNAKSLEQFKDGGKMNVIVDGKLHSEKHDLIDNVEVPITNKGIPVIAMEEGGKATEQTAEVERDELILHLELTKKLEELKKDGSDEAMIEAGKLLSEEIVKNTKDSKSKILKNA